MIILHPYREDRAGLPRYHATHAALAALVDAGMTVVDLPCGDDRRYEEGLKHFWGSDDLLIVEHDIVPSLAMVRDLTTCPSVVCAQDYPLYYRRADWRLLEQMGDVAAAAPPTEAARRARARLAVFHTRGHDDPVRSGWGWTSAHRVLDPDGPRWLAPGELFADYIGLGLTKIGQGLQRHRPDWESGPWWDLDSRWSRWLARHHILAHIHYPTAAHHHGCACHTEEDDWSHA